MGDAQVLAFFVIGGLSVGAAPGALGARPLLAQQGPSVVTDTAGAVMISGTGKYLIPGLIAQRAYFDSTYLGICLA